jgi:hypothetical protein
MDIFCDSCGQRMTLAARLPNGTTKKGGNSYRRRRYECKLCGITELIHADGAIDLEHEPEWAKAEVEQMYKKQEQNERRD